MSEQEQELRKQILDLQERIERLEARRYYVLVKKGPKDFQMTRVQGWDGEGLPPFPTDDDNQGQ